MHVNLVMPIALRLNNFFILNVDCINSVFLPIGFRRLGILLDDIQLLSDTRGF